MLHNSERDFIKRHIGTSEENQKKMLNQIGYKSLDDLINNTVPEKILFKDIKSIKKPNPKCEKMLEYEEKFLLLKFFNKSKRV